MGYWTSQEYAIIKWLIAGLSWSLCELYKCSLWRLQYILPVGYFECGFRMPNCCSCMSNGWCKHCDCVKAGHCCVDCWPSRNVPKRCLNVIPFYNSDEPISSSVSSYSAVQLLLRCVMIVMIPQRVSPFLVLVRLTFQIFWYVSKTKLYMGRNGWNHFYK